MKRRERQESDIEQNYNVVYEVWPGVSKDCDSNFAKKNPTNETPILIF